MNFPTAFEVEQNARVLTAALAEVASHCEGFMFYEYLPDHLPTIAGFSYVATGSSRTCWYHETGFVYKVEFWRFYPNFQKNFGSSELEFDNYRRILTENLVPEGWAMAPMRLFTVDGAPIIVARYVPGKPMGRWDSEFNSATGLFDCIGHNVIELEGKKWVVDLGV